MGASEDQSKNAVGLSQREAQVYVERLHGILTYSGVTMALITGFWLIAGEWVRGSNYLAFTLCIAVALWMRRIPRVADWTSKVYATGLLSMLVLDSILTGLTQAPALWVMPIVPMLTAHLMGARSVFPWSFFTVLGIAFVYWVEGTGWRPPAVTTSEGEPLFVLVSTAAGYARVGYSALISTEKSVARSNCEATELIQSRFSADRSSAAKSAFLANMSEQIKIPLQGAIDDSKALLRETSRAERESCLALDESVRRVSTIVNDIVDISRMETGVLLAESSALNLRLLFESMALEISSVAERRGVRVVWRIAKSPFPVVGDSRRVSRLANILVRDAIASAGTRVNVTVEVKAAEPPEPEGVVRLQLCVSRDGEPQVVDRSELVFGLRVHENERDVDVETGLGIAMAESICQFMGGSLEFRGADAHNQSVTVACVCLARPGESYLVSSEDQSRCA